MSPEAVPAACRPARRSSAVNVPVPHCTKPLPATSSSHPCLPVTMPCHSRPAKRSSAATSPPHPNLTIPNPDQKKICHTQCVSRHFPTPPLSPQASPSLLQACQVLRQLQPPYMQVPVPTADYSTSACDDVPAAASPPHPSKPAKGLHLLPAPHLHVRSPLSLQGSPSLVQAYQGAAFAASASPACSCPHS